MAKSFQIWWKTKIYRFKMLKSRNTKKITPGHIIDKLLKSNNKKKIFKVVREKWYIAREAELGDHELTSHPKL